eukprot:jgi/Ulvmu1/5233/UM022_0026.1
MEYVDFENNLVFQMTRRQATSTLGGTLDIFRSCVHIIVNSTFCYNGISSATMLPSKGALVIESPSCELAVVQSLFAHNQVHTSGAAMLIQSAVPGTMPRIESCIFTKNSAKQTGGALRIESVTGDILVDGSSFTDNWACAGGGGISIAASSNVLIRHSWIMGNTAIVQGCLPGSEEEWTLASGGGILHSSPSLLQLTNTSVLLNMAVSGGGIMASAAVKVSLVGGSVTFNRALHNGGGLSCQGCHLLRSISLFRSNTAMQGGGIFVRHGSEVSGSAGTEMFLDLSESQDYLQSLLCYALYVKYFYSNSTYPLRCDARLPLPFPTLSLDALKLALGERIHSATQLGHLNASNLVPDCGGVACTSVSTTSVVTMSDLQSSQALADAAVCFAWNSHRVSEEDIRRWHLDKTSPVRILSTCFIANSAASTGISGLDSVSDEQLARQAWAAHHNNEAACGMGNGGAACISLTLLGRIQVAKSLFWQNSATYGGGAYLTSGNTLIPDPSCELFPNTNPLFLPVHFADSTFTDNLCGPSRAGASVFWNTPYLLHITCSRLPFSHVPYEAGLPECSEFEGGEGVGQRYCHQCLLASGCLDWQGNSGGYSRPVAGVASQGAAAEQPSPSHVPSVIVPIAQKSASDSFLAWSKSQAATAPEAVTQRMLALGSARADGMASGGVMLQLQDPVVTGYAAGAMMNLTVFLLDAYDQVVNTDEHTATRPGSPLPTVTVSQSQSDVFLSGQLTQTFEAGVAVLGQLRLIGNPGQYSLQLESAGAESAVALIHVRSCVMGEVFVNQRCVVCGMGTIGFGPHDDSFKGSCATCPTHAQCYGSTMIVPKDGFAAVSPISKAMQKCPNPRACSYPGRQEQLEQFALSMACHHRTFSVDGSIEWSAVERCHISELAQSLRRVDGSDPDLTLAVEWMQTLPQCASGYTGLLCGQCTVGFGQGQSFTCTLCPSLTTSTSVAVAGIAAMLLVSWYTIHQASVDTNSSTSAHSSGSVDGQNQPIKRECDSIYCGIGHHSVPPRLQAAGSSNSRQDSLTSHALCESFDCRQASGSVEQTAQDVEKQRIRSGGQCALGRSQDHLVGTAGQLAKSRMANHSTLLGSINYESVYAPKPKEFCTDSVGPSMPASPSGGRTKEEHLENTEFQMAKILISYLQVVSVIRDVDIRLPGPIQRMFQLQGSASSLERMSAWDCYVLSGNIPALLGTAHASTARVGLMTASPFFFLAFWTIIWICEALCLCQYSRRPFDCLRQCIKRLIVTCLCIAFLMCPMVIGSSLEIFGCISTVRSDSAQNFPFDMVPVNSGSYWALDTGLQCWQGEHRNLVLYVGIPGLLLWCIGVPLLFFGALWRERRKLQHAAVRAYLGFLYIGYRHQHFYWEVVIIMRKILVVAITTLVHGTERSQLRLMLMLGIIWLALVMQVMLRPYAKNLLNRAEVVSLSATSATLYLSSFLMDSDTTTTKAVFVLTATLLTTNICVMAWFAAIIMRVGTESFLKFIGAMDQHEEQMGLRHIKAAPRQAWASASKRLVHLRSMTFRSGRISSQLVPNDVLGGVDVLGVHQDGHSLAGEGSSEEFSHRGSLFALEAVKEDPEFERDDPADQSDDLHPPPVYEGCHIHGHDTCDVGLESPIASQITMLPAELHTTGSIKRART